MKFRRIGIHGGKEHGKVYILETNKILKQGPPNLSASRIREVNPQ